MRIDKENAMPFLSKMCKESIYVDFYNLIATVLAPELPLADNIGHTCHWMTYDPLFLK